MFDNTTINEREVVGGSRKGWVVGVSRLSFVSTRSFERSILIVNNNNSLADKFENTVGFLLRRGNAVSRRSKAWHTRIPYVSKPTRSKSMTLRGVADSEEDPRIKSLFKI